jgi:LytR cell envelope-related transcriptional attenuator
LDHPLPSVGRWRTRALVAATVAALELALLVAIAVVVVAPALLGGVEEAVRTRELAPASAKPAPKRHEPPPMLERTATSVLVLNGNGISGAAAATAARVRGLSYVVTGVGNATRADYAKTMVMYRGDHRREAQRLAKDLGVKLVGPLDGLRSKDLMGAKLAVILGS